MKKLQVDNETFFSRVVQLLSEGRQVTIPVKGYSMLPFIRGERDLVVLEKPGTLKVGDMVLFRSGGRYVLHRIVEIGGEGLRIQGDGVLRGEERCTPDAVAGKVIRILRGGRRPVDPETPFQQWRSRTWRALRPYRRPLLLAWRLLPWNFWIFLQQHKGKHAKEIQTT